MHGKNNSSKYITSPIAQEGNDPMMIAYQGEKKKSIQLESSFGSPFFTKFVIQTKEIIIFLVISYHHLSYPTHQTGSLCRSHNHYQSSNHYLYSRTISAVESYKRPSIATEIQEVTEANVSQVTWRPITLTQNKYTQ